MQMQKAKGKRQKAKGKRQKAKGKRQKTIKEKKKRKEKTLFFTPLTPKASSEKN